MRSARTRAVYVGGLAAAGVLLTHVLAYAIVAPRASSRAELLESTGHGAWPYVVAALLAAFVAGAALFVVNRLQGSGSARSDHLYGATALRLVVVQPLAFFGLECLERVAAGHDLASTFTEPVVLVGLVVQAVVALLGALFLVALAGAVDAVVRRLLPSPGRVTARLPRPPLRASRPIALVGVGAATLRGPPPVR